MTNNLRKILLLVLLLLLTYIAYWYMVKPVNADITAQKQLAQTRLEKLMQLSLLAESKNAIFAAKYLNKQIEQLQHATTFFEEKLPPESNIHEMLEQVVAIAQKQGLKPKTTRTLKKKNDNRGYIEQPFKMGLEGDFNSFYSFILELEKLPRVVKVRELKLTKLRPGTGKQNEVVAADMVVSIFFKGS